MALVFGKSLMGYDYNLTIDGQIYLNQSRVTLIGEAGIDLEIWIDEKNSGLIEYWRGRMGSNVEFILTRGEGAVKEEIKGDGELKLVEVSLPMGEAVSLRLAFGYDAKPFDLRIEAFMERAMTQYLKRATREAIKAMKEFILETIKEAKIFKKDEK